MCWKCKSTVTLEEPVPRVAECPVCHADMHSCRNCVFYEPGAHYDCHETVSEMVKDKERANFCGDFKVRREWGGSDGKAQDARKKFDSLFSV